eukprot:7643812-Pyramimonas_sp.AAC.1
MVVSGVRPSCKAECESESAGEGQSRRKISAAVEFQVASFNAQSIRQAHRHGKKARNRSRRAAALRSQMYRKGIHIVGVQEGRNEKGTRRAGDW